MKQKRFIKLAMGNGFPRNYANAHKFQRFSADTFGFNIRGDYDSFFRNSEFSVEHYKGYTVHPAEREAFLARPEVKTGRISEAFFSGARFAENKNHTPKRARLIFADGEKISLRYDYSAF